MALVAARPLKKTRRSWAIPTSEAIRPLYVGGDSPRCMFLSCLLARCGGAGSAGALTPLCGLSIFLNFNGASNTQHATPLSRRASKHTQSAEGGPFGPINSYLPLRLSPAGPGAGPRRRGTCSTCTRSSAPRARRTPLGSRPTPRASWGRVAE